MQEMNSRFQVLEHLTEQGVPMFLTGDFNVPSHLDWTEETKEGHFGVTVEWPVSKRLKQLHFRVFLPRCLS
ncbi:hypothetical protein [Paenibacillus alvei]|uniref:Endonuclease/exonuclease/phosphatase domain-containing protein n=1 Tax=Paenibacillus alvei TaxID=44250 RepID=A0AAP6ZWA1_PAEAL|nr:hypothetical protein [Paenibacillus alvei]MBG9733118.1 hypothetical protein [Paenibacillus alvei]MBG9745322.1 hypothetical protein [Paenibacillus alvei]MCY9580519.1 hypothetical protein [Paenibacillus alvei]MCY9585003.1 hypothetical protein [Paenibacillus alvei]NEZ44570.1 hypothetical protein [Paenibacillus alvei]